MRNLERLIEELEYHGVPAGRLTVWVGYKNGQAGVGQTSAAVSRATGSTSSWTPPAPACGGPGSRTPWRSKMHLIAENLTPRRDCPLDLFEPPERRAQAEAVARLKREINARHGRFVLRSAATLALAAIYRDTANEYDICDVRGKICF